jgi:hypothetical protein
MVTGSYRSKRQDQTLCRHCVDTVQLIHAKPAIESPPTRPWPPTPAAVRRPACPRLAVAPAHDAANQDTTGVPGLPAAHAPPSPVPPPYRQASQSLPSCVQLPPSTPCRLATSPFRTRKNVLHAYTTQYRPAASARQVGLRSHRKSEGVRGMFREQSWKCCLWPSLNRCKPNFRGSGIYVPRSVDWHPA